MAQPGEFTRFLTVQPPSGRKAHQPVPEPPKPAPAVEPGGFTEFLRSPAPPQQQPPAGPGSIEAAKPGEFTRVFQSPLARSGKKSQFDAPPPVGREAGEFTRMLEAVPDPQGLARGVPAAPAAPQQPAGDATRAFLNANPPSAPPAEQGPSEFTRMFKAPAKAPAAPATKPAAKAPPKRVAVKKKKSNLPWILAVFAVIVIVGMLLFFALR
jgi:hypothetical protein